MNSNRTSVVAFVFGSFVGLALMVGPFLVDAIPAKSKLIIAIFGAVTFFLFSVAAVVTKLYCKTSADEAFVRTGVGGQRCVIDGGAIVIPVIHETIPVSLRSLKLEVDRTGAEALITADYLRADVKAVFYVHVQKDRDSILTAATSLGSSSSDPRAVQNLIFEKLVSALRTVAATQKLHDLNADRARFAKAVQESVEQDLKSNGLTLESVTISYLDQAPLDAMRPEQNVFDAQGAKTIAEQVQQQRVERNLIERQADQKVKAQNVETSQYLANQEIVEAKAHANAQAEKKKAQSEAEQRAASFAADQSRMAGVAHAQSVQAIKVAEVEQTQAIEVANQRREQATREAEITKQRAIELADREKQIAVAEAERQRAEAEALQLAASQKRAVEDQAVHTVEVTATAEREKSRTVITQQAEIEKERLQKQMEADIAAYTQIKASEAEQTAAEKRASARITLAQAEKNAKSLEAEGDRAARMVPVNVDREQVNVEEARISVKIKELKGQSDYASIARELQVELAKIQADRDARIAAAEAFGQALSSSKMTIWGDPDALRKMSSAFFNAQAFGQYVDGFASTLPPDIRQAATAGLSGLGKVVAGAIKKATGVDLDPSVVEESIRTLAASKNNGEDSGNKPAA